MMKRSGNILFTQFLLIFAFYSSLPASDLQDLKNRVRIKELSNGLIVVYAQKPGLSIFRGICGYRVGSVDDPPELSGTAHLLEHLLFDLRLESGNKMKAIYRELSQQYGKGTEESQDKIAELEEKLADHEKLQKKSGIYSDIYQTYQEAGGKDTWAVTTHDLTYCAATLPNEKIDLFCYLESERLANVLDSITPGEVVSEQSILLDERKREFDDKPMGALFEKRHSLAFSKNPYRYPVAGLASDIPSISLKDVQEFKHKYYTPNNCVLVIVGDLQVNQLFNKIDMYFGDIPAGEKHTYLIIKDPPQLREQRITMESTHDSILTLSYHKPSFPHKDDITSKIIVSLLTRGDDSRLSEDLVKNRKIATRVGAGSGPGERYDNLFTITAVPSRSQGLMTLEKAILEHLERLKIEAISNQELERAIDTFKADTSEHVNSDIKFLGMTLLRNQLIHGDWSLFLKCIENCRSVSSEDINQFARKYFKKENSIVTVLKGPA